MPNRWRRWLAVGLWAALIYYFSAAPAYKGPETLSLLGRLFPWLPPSFLSPLNFLVRKGAHLTVFGVLALLLRWALPPARWVALWAWLLATLYAGTDEWHQAHVPGRSGQFGDVMLDSVGALLALGVLAGWRRRRRGGLAPGRGQASSPQQD